MERQLGDTASFRLGEAMGNSTMLVDEELDI